MALPEYYNGSNWTLFGTVSSIGITGSTGLGITGSPITSAGTINLTLGSELQALSAFASTGLMARTGSGSYAGRTLIGSTGINITNGDGLLGNPTISVSTIDINTNTTGLLAISRLAGYDTALTTTFLKGDSTWSLVDINNNTTGSLLPSRISGYPSNSSLFLNGFGSWTAPSFPNLITTSNSIYNLTINNTNTSSTATDLLIKNNGNYGVAFGFNNSTNEAYMWGYGTENLKFGTNSTKRMQLLNNGTLDLLTNDLITTGTINAKTGTLKGNNLAVFSSGSIQVLNSLAMGNNGITGLANPVNPQDAATKSYADSAVSSANTKLQYFGSWDSTYPIYVTRSMYLNNSYTPPLKQYGTYGYLTGNGTTGSATDSPVYDIKCNSRIRASEFNAWSSKNIKNILSIGKKAGEEASKILQDIPIVKYNYKDPIVDGKGEFFGVISEELLDYLPSYVTTNEFRFTPNIMMFGKLNSIDYQYFTILLQDDKTLDESFIGKKIQILKDNSGVSGILESIENKLLTVKLESKLIITEKDLDVFVYGSYEDCPTVSLKHLSELSLCALKDCIERISKLEQIKEV